VGVMSDHTSGVFAVAAWRPEIAAARKVCMAQ